MYGHKYTKEEHEFLKTFIPSHTTKEVVEEYNSRFVEPITLSRVKGYMANHKIRNGVDCCFKKGNIPHNKGKHVPTVGRMAETQFKKGELPPNTKPVGYERITRDGYIEVRLEMKKDRNVGDTNFVLKHRLVWEQANGPIPKNHIVIFLDGNKQNCNLENLALISRAEHLQMTRAKLRSENPKFTETGVLIARTEVTRRKMKKERKKKNERNSSCGNNN